jgi:hypothetical protein
MGSSCLWQVNVAKRIPQRRIAEGGADAAVCVHVAVCCRSAIVNSVYRDGRIFNVNWLPVKLPELLRQFK